MFSTSIFSVLLQENKERLQDIAILYSSDTLREETRILVEDIVLEALVKLERLKFKMNRSIMMD